MFSVVYVYLDHLKFCVVCIDGRRYVCCSECNVVSNECNEPTSGLSRDSLCIWQVQVSVFCAWRIPAYLRCTQCLNLTLWTSAS